MTDELFRNENVEEDCVLLEEEEETSVSIPPVIFINKEHITCVVAEKKINIRWCNEQSSTTTNEPFTCEICKKIYQIEKH